jgi:hypothetical protein
MVQLYLISFLLLQCLIGGKSERSSQNTQYLEDTRQFMKHFRESSHLMDTLFIENFTSVARTCVEEAFKDSTHLSEGDRQEIRAWLDHPPLNSWTPDLVGGPAKIISQDSLGLLVKAAIARSPVRGDYSLGIRVYSFSAPIFFHDNTLCLFNSSSYCGGLCGGGQLYLLRKDGGQWKVINSFCGWMS